MCSVLIGRSWTDIDSIQVIMQHDKIFREVKLFYGFIIQYNVYERFVQARIRGKMRLKRRNRDFNRKAKRLSRRLIRK